MIPDPRIKRLNATKLNEQQFDALEAHLRGRSTLAQLYALELACDEQKIKEAA